MINQLGSWYAGRWDRSRHGFGVRQLTSWRIAKQDQNHHSSYRWNNNNRSHYAFRCSGIGKNRYQVYCIGMVILASPCTCRKTWMETRVWLPTIGSWWRAVEIYSRANRRHVFQTKTIGRVDQVIKQIDYLEKSSYDAEVTKNTKICTYPSWLALVLLHLAFILKCYLKDGHDWFWTYPPVYGRFYYPINYIPDSKEQQQQLAKSLVWQKKSTLDNDNWPKEHKTKSFLYLQWAFVFIIIALANPRLGLKEETATKARCVYHHRH